MKTQGSVLGALVFVWVVVGLVAVSAYFSGERRRGFLALLLGVLATMALIGAGEEISLAMSQPPVSKWLGIGAVVLFGLMMIDCLRGIRRNGVKPLALAGFVIVLVVLVLACTGCWANELINETNEADAQRTGLSKEKFSLSPGGMLEGVLKYQSFQDGIAIFEYLARKDMWDTTAVTTRIGLEQMRVEYDGKSLYVNQMLHHYNLNVWWYGANYRVIIYSISSTGQVEMQLDQW